MLSSAVTRKSAGMLKPADGQRHRHQRRDDHEQRVEDVVRRDDARPMARLAAGLDQRVERHAVEAAEHREQEQVGQHVPVRAPAEEFADAQQMARRRQRMTGEEQVDREHAHADRAERHQADLDAPLRQLFAHQRADADADRERRRAARSRHPDRRAARPSRS